MDAAVFGRFLAETRRAQDLTQAELAGRIGVTDKAVRRWERGVGFPDINTLEPLARRRISGCFLLAGTGLTLALLLTMGVPAQVLLWGLFAGLCLLLALSARP